MVYGTFLGLLFFRNKSLKGVVWGLCSAIVLVPA